MAKGGLRRPTKMMMFAVNAAIDGKKDEVDRIVTEYGLDRKELRQRIEYRDGQKYEIDLGRKRKAPARRATAMAGANHAVDLNMTVNGRTSVANLFHWLEEAGRVRAMAQQQLARRKPEEIEPVKKAFAQVELLRREREKIEEKIREAEEALG